MLTRSTHPFWAKSNPSPRGGRSAGLCTASASRGYVSALLARAAAGHGGDPAVSDIEMAGDCPTPWRRAWSRSVPTRARRGPWRRRARTPRAWPAAHGRTRCPPGTSPVRRAVPLVGRRSLAGGSAPEDTPTCERPLIPAARQETVELSRCPARPAAQPSRAAGDPGVSEPPRPRRRRRRGVGARGAGAGRATPRRSASSTTATWTPCSGSSTSGSATGRSPRTSPRTRSCARSSGSAASPGRAATSAPGWSRSPATSSPTTSSRAATGSR